MRLVALIEEGATSCDVVSPADNPPVAPPVSVVTVGVPSFLRSDSAAVLVYALSLRCAGGGASNNGPSVDAKRAADTAYPLQSMDCKHSTIEYRGQLMQDRIVLELLCFKRGGYFVEVGAWHSILINNTYVMEAHFGWNGLCTDPFTGYCQVEA